MTSNEILQADLLDILFEKRNKVYGAYILRKYYNTHLLQALAISFGMVIIFVILVKNMQSPVMYTERIFDTAPDSVLVHRIVEKPPKPAIIHPAIQASTAQKIFTTRLQIAMNPPPGPEMPAIADLTNVAVGNRDITGPETPAIQPALPGVETNEKTAGEKKSDFEPVEKQPEFPGGMRAWTDFLARNLRTPDDLEPGQKKMVLIRFVVGADGVVSQFAVVQSAGSELDNEVIRVLKKMPKWKPALQNGHAISISFTQPVTFMGTEQ